jgi:hypothetical protein
MQVHLLVTCTINPNDVNATADEQQMKDAVATAIENIIHHGEGEGFSHPLEDTHCIMMASIAVQDDPDDFDAKQYTDVVCPHCGHDLREGDTRGESPNGVIIVYGTDDEDQFEHKSVLDDEGTLVDVEDVVAGGLHKETLCAKCRKSLVDIEIIK